MRMKFALIMTLLLLIAKSSFAITYQISLEEALNMAKSRFAGQDVDYYLIKDGNNKAWTIFIDAEPTKSWTHHCFTVSVPTTTHSLIINIPEAVRVPDQMPPNYDMEPLDVKDRYDRYIK